MKQKMKSILTTSFMFLLFGCLSTQPIDTVSQVKIINFQQTKDLNCTQIDLIEAFGKKSMTADADRRNAFTEFKNKICLLYTSPSPRDAHESRMPSSA